MNPTNTNNKTVHAPKQKKSRKRIFITAAVLLVVGLIISTVALAAVNFDIHALDPSGPYMNKEAVYGQEVVNLRIEDVSANIVLTRSDNQEVQVHYQENDYEKYELQTNEAGTLTIRKIDRTPWLHFLWLANRMELKVALPSDFSGEVSIQSTNSKIDLRDVHLAALDIDTKNGGISLQRVQIEGDAEMRSTNSSLDSLDSVIGGNLRYQSTNGSLDMVSTAVEGELHFQTSNGGARIENSSAHSAAVRSTNGKILVTDYSVVTSLFLKTTNGAINSVRSRAESWDVNTTNGAIHLEVRGAESDYSIDLQTTNGSTSPANIIREGARVIRAESTNGSVNVTFVGEE